MTGPGAGPDAPAVAALITALAAAGSTGADAARHRALADRAAAAGAAGAARLCRRLAAALAAELAPTPPRTDADTLGPAAPLDHPRAAAAARRAAAAKAAGHPAEVSAAWLTALAADPEAPTLYTGYGLARAAEGRHAEAIAAHRAALALDPGFAGAWHNLAVALVAAGRPAMATVAAHAAVAAAPGFAAAWCQAAELTGRDGDGDAGDAAGRAGITADPSSPLARHTGALAAQAAGRRAAAATAFRAAICLAPDFAEAHANLAQLVREDGRLADAIAGLGRALALQLTAPEGALASWAQYRRHLCRWDGQAAIDRRLIQLVRAGRGDRIPPFTLLAAGAGPADQRLGAAAYAATRAAALGDHALAPPHTDDRRPNRRLKLGYLSSDFHDHATARLIVELFERHDRDRFDVIGYSYGPDDGSALRRRLLDAFDRTVELSRLGDRAAARQIRADEIDLVIELKGHTHGARPGIAAHRPAPIQVHYLGYPGTTGAPWIDYLIADPVVVPAEHAGRFTERLVHLPHCYQITDRTRPLAAPPPRAACGLPPAGFVFGCLGQPYKLTPTVFAIWMRLLHQVPNSVLWLLDGGPEVRANLARAATRHGVAAERLVFAPRAPPAAHLARMSLADLMLDTFPVTAHTGASDALWAGTPLLTCRGDSFVARVAASVLDAAGLPELVAPSLVAYEATARRLALAPDVLATLRHRLAATRLSCPLFDSAATTRALEAAYRTMWCRHCAGDPPAGFAVPP